ncbi:MAG TPA: GC-type dockerin domain-anchored protein [Phycisphaerales bacterium]|nr:GC-type dockerin domain-anchored protein [Phycisphaerales bacterium]
MRHVTGPLRFLALAALTAPALGDGVLCLERAYLGTCDTPGFARRVTLVDSIAYTADWYGGLSTIDVSDPNAPVLLGTYDVNYVFEVEVVDSIAYAACAHDGLHILDVSDPSLPVLIGEFDAGGEVRAVVVRGDMAFIAVDERGFKILDIADPAFPRLLGGHGYPAKDLDVADSTVYVVGGGSIWIYDASDPTAPTLVGESHAGNPWGVEVVADRVFAYEDWVIQVLDVSEPTSPIILGTYDAVDGVQSLAIEDTLVYIADTMDGSGVQVVDFADPANPMRLMRYGTAGAAKGVAVSGGLAHVADGDAGLQIIRLDPSHAEPWIGGSDTSGTRDMTTDQGTVYVIGPYVLEAFDTTGPDAPVLLGNWESDRELEGVTVYDGRAYLARGSYGLAILDVTDPQNMALLGEIDGPGFASGVAASGGTAYIANGGSQVNVLVVDVTDPVAPRLLSSCDLPGSTVAVATAGTLVFAAAGADGGLQIIDVSDPLVPLVVGAMDTTGAAADVAVFENTVVLADGSGGVLLVDVSDPVQPELRSAIDIQTSRIAPFWPRLLLSEDHDLKLFDLTIPDTAREVFSFDTGYRWLGEPALAGEVACILGTDGLQDLVLLDLSDCPPCPADFNADSEVDSRDVIAFLDAWVAERTQDCSSGGCATDLDDNGVVDSRDVVAFLNAWAAGC